MTDRDFNTDEALAYFITWTTYGTWLPGDQRGWNRKDDPDIQEPNEFVESLAAERMNEAPLVLKLAERQIVDETIRRHCTIRNWPLHALNARSNHVHVIVTAPSYDPETVRDQFKSWCTRMLKPVLPGRSNFWTERGSCRWINCLDDLETVVTYVKDCQD